MSDRQEADKVDLRSADIAEDKRRELLRLFPEARTEGVKVDFDRLKLALGETLDIGRERYGMNWPGKADCFKAIQAPSLATLRPCREESINFDTTENLIIEGDNLEVLKLLQKSYLGRVKMIYIDPPYNTGNDFIYPDNYSESLQTYLEYTGQVDAEGMKFGTNPETAGRFHSNWLRMMYPRLYLGRNLLSNDGFMIVSIDDREVANLRFLLNELFGEENWLGTLVWDRNRKNDATFVSVGHEYMHVFAKDKQHLNESDVVLRGEKEGVLEIKSAFSDLRSTLGDDWAEIRKALLDIYSTWNNDDPRKPLSRFSKIDEKGPYRTDGDISWPGGNGPTYEVLHPTTHKPCKQPTGGWRFPTAERFWEEYGKGRIAFGANETTMPSIRRNLFSSEQEVMRSVQFSYAQTATQEFVKLFVGKRVFDNPKHFEDIRQLVEYFTDEDDIVLDFFAGSGTTGHAVMLAGKNRRFCLVQLPEPTEDGGVAATEGYTTIADITKERVRRVILKLDLEDASKLSLETKKQKRGFRVFKLAESNLVPWNADSSEDPGTLEKQLELHVEHIRRDRSAEDMLFEILLKDGYPPTTQVTRVPMAGEKTFSASDGGFVVCLDRGLSLDRVRVIADLEPQRVVCLDEGFAGNDQLKANAVQIFKSKGIVFRTV